eukprot:1149260-Pelagomonas_calceolata.AAC.1
MGKIQIHVFRHCIRRVNGMCISDGKYAPLMICQPFTVAYSGIKGYALISVAQENYDKTVRGKWHTSKEPSEMKSEIERGNGQRTGKHIYARETWGWEKYNHMKLNFQGMDTEMETGHATDNMLR